MHGFQGGDHGLSSGLAMQLHSMYVLWHIDILENAAINAANQFFEM